MTRLGAAVSGDVGDVRTITLNGVNGGVDLTNVTSVRCTVQHTVTDEVAVLDASVTNAATNEVTIELGTWLSDGPTVGTWAVQTETTWANSDVITWPSPAVPDTILVAADHD